MTLLIDQINFEIDKHSLLKHKFYQMWQEGKLTLDHLSGYSKEYYQLVKNVPNFVQNILNNNPNPKYNKIIEGNLIEEREHIAPWEEFASSLKIKHSDLKKYGGDSLTNNAVQRLNDISNSSFEEGIAAMYAFEKQLPKISQTKRAGLVDFYGLTEENAHKYFKIHEEVDVMHAKIWENILNECSSDKHQRILDAVRESLSAQNSLLDAVQQKYVEK
ncbi:MAG: iron-containing redox enzyme family protein [Candidatus Nitrosocosmicus sp.]